MSRRGKKASRRDRESRRQQRLERRARRKAQRQEVHVPDAPDIGDVLQRKLRNAFVGIHPLSAVERMEEMHKGQMRRTRKNNIEVDKSYTGQPSRTSKTRRGYPKKEAV